MKILTILLIASAFTVRATPEEDINAILAVGPEGRNHAPATAAWNRLTNGTGPEGIPPLLHAMNRAGELSANWLRGAVSVLSQGQAAAAPKLPLAEITAFARDTANKPAPRVLAWQLLERYDKAAWDQLAPGLLLDPAAPLRREPVQRLIDIGKKGGDVTALRQALEAARDEDQITAAADALREKGESVDLPRHFGFLMDWHITGPFDNRGRKGHETAFPPETSIDTAAVYDGMELKAGEKNQIKWLPYTSASQFGIIDINKPLGMLKNATAYATTVWNSPEERTAEVRLGSKNAWKVWLNGRLLFARDEYHRGMMIDQYTMPVSLKKGPNIFLVKCCQNEQTETWTVEWNFQLRICDSTGTAILDPARPPTPAAALKAENAAK